MKTHPDEATRLTELDVPRAPKLHTRVLARFGRAAFLAVTLSAVGLLAFLIGDAGNDLFTPATAHTAAPRSTPAVTNTEPPKTANCPATSKPAAIHIDAVATAATVQGQLNRHLMVSQPTGYNKTYIAGQSTNHGPTFWCRVVGEKVTIDGPGITDGTYAVTSRQIVGATDLATISKILESADVLGYTNVRPDHLDPNRWAVGFKLIKAAN